MTLLQIYEASFSDMDLAYDEWFSACKRLDQNPNSPLRLKEVDRLHALFLIKKKEHDKLMSDIFAFIKQRKAQMQS